MDEAAKTPPIYINTVADFFYDLWGEVFRCPTNGHGNTILWIEDFRKSKISEFNISLVVDYDILRFEAK